MKHKTKVIILSIITAFLVLFAVLRVVSAVRADDTPTNEFNVMFRYGSKDGTVSYDVQFSYTLPDGYYLVGLLNPITATDSSTHFFQLFSVNPQGKTYEWLGNKDVHNFVSIRHEKGKDDVTDIRDSYTWAAIMFDISTFSVSGIPVYLYPNYYGYLSDDTFWNNVIDVNTFPTYGSSCPWDSSNHYGYSSTYSEGVTAPSVREVLLSYGYYNSSPTDNSTSDSDGGHSGGGGSLSGRVKQYIVDVKYQVPNTDTSDYYTEFWLDVPTGRDKDNNITYHKVCAAEFKTSELLNKNIIQVSNGQGGWTSVDKGSYYSIYRTWNELIARYCSVDSAKMYGGCIAYLRNAIHLTDNKTLVSDYVYFTLNPDKVNITDEGASSAAPTIYNKKGTLNENGSSNNDTSNDKISDNSGDFDYIGGITDKPKDYIHNDGTGDSDGGHSGGGGHGGGRGDSDTSFIPSSSWTLSDFVNWVKNGFGLFGNNGILTMVKDIFGFLPEDVFNVIMWVVLCAGFIAVIKLAF